MPDTNAGVCVLDDDAKLCVYPTEFSAFASGIPIST
jgi:hypothetical protein